MPMKGSGGNVEQIEQQRDYQQSPGVSLSQAQQGSQRGSAVDTQAAHADGNGRTLDQKTAGRVLMAEAGEETADEQRDKRMAGGHEGCRQRHQGQGEGCEGDIYFQQVIASWVLPSTLAFILTGGARLPPK